jgi:hypothetical protein
MSKTLRVVLTDEFAFQLEDSARSLGQTLSEYVRRKIGLSGKPADDLPESDVEQPVVATPEGSLFKVGDVVETRDGRKARIICVDRKGSSPIVALVAEPDGELVTYHRQDGRWAYDTGDDCHHDLMPPKRVGYVNIYTDGSASNVCKSRRDADDREQGRMDCGLSLKRFVCLRIEYLPWQFDE